MSGVLRLALVYFSVVPLQRWISLIGAALLLLSAILVLGTGTDGRLLALLGAGMLVMGPILMGGGMHRRACSRTLLHLRPHGRLRMLLAATLVITLLASIAALGVLILHALPFSRTDDLPFREVSPFAMFAISWSVGALMWAGTFVTGGSQLQGLLFAFVPLLLLKFGEALAVLVPSPPLMLAAGALTWVAFALWYMHVRSIRQVPSYGERTPVDPDGPVAGFLQSRFESRRGVISLPGALNLYLLGASSLVTRALLLGITWVWLGGILLIMLATMVFTGLHSGIAKLMAQLIFLPLFMITSASTGFSLTRRARMLWLRPGQDRAALFARAERNGLTFCLLTMGVAACAFLAFSLANWPDRAPAILAFGAAQVVFACCLFYGGLSLTRGWAAADVLLCIALNVLFLVEVITLRPWSEERTGTATLLGILLLLVPVLRWHAHRRWRAIDWCVARLLSARRPT